jgi:hypothetical protein
MQKSRPLGEVTSVRYKSLHFSLNRIFPRLEKCRPKVCGPRYLGDPPRFCLDGKRRKAERPVESPVAGSGVDESSGSNFFVCSAISSRRHFPERFFHAELRSGLRNALSITVRPRNRFENEKK